MGKKRCFFSKNLLKSEKKTSPKRAKISPKITLKNIKKVIFSRQSR
jgi:hypothetical protein